MKITLTTLSCVLLLVGAGRAEANDTTYRNPPNPPLTSGSDAGYVGDEAGYIGDLDDPSLRGQAYSFVGDSPAAADASDASIPTMQSIPYSHGVPVASPLAGGYRSETYCDTGFGSVGGVLNACNDHWLRAETLLWFTEQRESPSLVTTGPTLADQQSQFGNPIESGLAPGYRLDYGQYFADGRFGIGARVWGLYGENEDYAIASDDPNAGFILRPFLDTDRNGDLNQVIVSGPLGNFTGEFDAESELDIIATEAYGRVLFGQAQDYRIDMIGGYSYFGIDDELTIRSTSVGGLPVNSTSYFDSFQTENRFHGGQFGFETMLNKGRWSMTSLTKVHLGNMNQRVNISGSAQRGLVPLAPPTTVSTGHGFFALDQQGSHERDDFTFIPEINVKLGYAVRENVSLTVGYSFLYWNSVAFAGEQLDPHMSGTQITSFVPFVPQPTDYAIQEDGFWIQGIDLGLNITF